MKTNKKILDIIIMAFYYDGTNESLIVLFGLISMAILFSCFMSKMLYGTICCCYNTRRVSNMA